MANQEINEGVDGSYVQDGTLYTVDENSLGQIAVFETILGDDVVSYLLDDEGDA